MSDAEMIKLVTKIREKAADPVFANELKKRLKERGKFNPMIDKLIFRKGKR